MADQKLIPSDPVSISTFDSTVQCPMQQAFDFSDDETDDRTITRLIFLSACKEAVVRSGTELTKSATKTINYLAEIWLEAATMDGRGFTTESDDSSDW